MSDKENKSGINRRQMLGTTAAGGAAIAGFGAGRVALVGGTGAGVLAAGATPA
ncbi:MAG: hypothetical protein JJ938_16805, partial [Roseicyclus sp.]|nr:hypothetical protein [Roseicyclus sp.]